MSLLPGAIWSLLYSPWSNLSPILTNDWCWQPTQGGTLGMALDCEWGEPLTSSGADKEAAERHVLFQMGWWELHQRIADTLLLRFENLSVMWLASANYISAGYWIQFILETTRRLCAKFLVIGSLYSLVMRLHCWTDQWTSWVSTITLLGSYLTASILKVHSISILTVIDRFSCQVTFFLFPSFLKQSFARIRNAS